MDEISFSKKSKLNKMNIVKTTDLKKQHINQLRFLFKDSFGKLPNEKKFLNKYTSDCLGFSFHCLFFNSKKDLVGSFTLIPKTFIHKKKELIGLHLIDTCFPYPGAVNPFSIKRALFKTFDQCSSLFDKKNFLYGFPNNKIIKLWDVLLNWQYIDCLHSMIDFFPIITILTQRYESINDNNLILKSPTLLCNPRLFSFKELSLNFASQQIINFWLIRRLIPVQILDQNIHITKQKLLSGLNLFEIWRLFIPSIICKSTKKRRKFWHYPLKSFKFPIFILDPNNIFEFNNLVVKPSFIWNDVP